MLCGLIEPTAGGATYKGLSTADMDNFRQSIGFCPQHDILQKELNVKETLLLFAGVKGVPSAQEREATVEHWLKLLELDQFRTKVVDQLSGGWKRRLCLAMALIGGSELVFLDEVCVPSFVAISPEHCVSSLPLGWTLKQGTRHGMCYKSTKPTK